MTFTILGRPVHDRRERDSHGAHPGTGVYITSALVRIDAPERDRLLAGVAGHAVPVRAAKPRPSPDENHLYFDPGDGRLITVFTNESRKDDPTPHPRDVGHPRANIAFNVSRATQTQVARRLRRAASRSRRSTGASMDSDLLQRSERSPPGTGLLQVPDAQGLRDADVLKLADTLRRQAGDHHITERHLADAIEQLMAGGDRGRT